MNRWLILLMAGFLVLSTGSGGDEMVAAPDPDAYLAQVMRNPHLHTNDHGEQFCWHAAHAADTFLDAFLALADPEWLAAAEKYYAFYLDKLRTDPDGYPG